MLGSATKIPHARACRFQGVRINLLERRLSALPDNDHIAILVRLGVAAFAAATLCPFLRLQFRTIWKQSGFHIPPKRY